MNRVAKTGLRTTWGCHNTPHSRENELCTLHHVISCPCVLALLFLSPFPDDTVPDPLSKHRPRSLMPRVQVRSQAFLVQRPVMAQYVKQLFHQVTTHACRGEAGRDVLAQQGVQTTGHVWHHLLCTSPVNIIANAGKHGTPLVIQHTSHALSHGTTSRGTESHHTWMTSKRTRSQ